MVIDVFSSEVEILRIRMKGYVNHGCSGWLRLTWFLRQNSWDPEPGVLIFRWTRPVQWYLTHHWYVWCQKLKTMQLQTLGTFLGVPKHFGNPKVLWFENACWWIFQRENCHFGVWEPPKRSKRIQRDLPKLIKLRTYLSYFRIGFQIWFFTSSLEGAVPKNPTVPDISSASRSNGHGMLNAWPSDPSLIKKNWPKSGENEVRPGKMGWFMWLDYSFSRWNGCLGHVFLKQTGSWECNSPLWV